MSLALSVVIPAYNEEHRLPEYLDRILMYLEHRNPSIEIIIVDDGSIDGTSGIAEHYRGKDTKVQFVKLEKNYGKGYTVRVGMLIATGELRLFADADGATPIEELERLMRAHEQGADVVVATRALHDDSCVVQGHITRKIIGTIFNLIVKTFAARGIHDTQCGFKLFTAEVARQVFPLQSIRGFAFDVEILFICRKIGCRIVEVPVNWTDIKGSKVKIICDSFRMLSDVIQIKHNDLCGKYSWMTFKRTKQ